MELKQIQVALVGFGGIGRTHVENLRVIDRVRVTDICTLDEKARAEVESLGANFFTDYALMLRESIADVVIVCTPTHMHATQVRQAILAGKHCICEKPLCLSAEEARSLFDLSEQRGVHLYVAHVLLFWEAYMVLTQLINSSRYGKLLDIALYRLSERPGWSNTNWLFEKDKSGLLPFDLHIHDLYFLISLFGKPRIGYVQHGSRNGVDYDEYLRVNYEYPGLTVTAEASWYNAPLPFTMGFRAYFEHAVVCLEDEHLLAFEQDGGMRKLAWHESKDAVETSVNVTPTSAFLHEMEHFMHCIAHGVPSDVVTPQHVLLTLQVLEDLVAEMETKQDKA